LLVPEVAGLCFRPVLLCAERKEQKEEKMKRYAACMVGVALAVSLLIAGYACAHENHEHTGKKLFTKHFQESLFDITGHASYSVEVLLDDKEYAMGKDVIGIVVHDARDEDVVGAVLTIVHKKLPTGENASGTPTVTDKGNGLYVVSGLNLQRDGRWELAITVKKGGIDDSVKFVLPDALKTRVPKGRYSP
jgi:hypothetical protein